MSNEDLVLRYQATQDQEQRQELLSMLYRQNEALIQKIANIYSGLCETADLMQEGFLGLLTAAEKWEPDGGSNFASYAYTWIRQAMRRYLDDSGNCIRIPVHMKEQLLEYRKYCAVFEKDHGRRPETKEILKALNLTREQFEKIRKADCMMLISSLASPVSNEDPDITLEDTLADPDDPIRATEERLQAEQLSEVLWGAVDSLPKKESAVIRKRYQEQKTLKETGADFGFSTDRARQIEAQALRKLRSGKTRKKLQPFLEENAIKYGYNASGLGTFRRTGSSSVELAVLAADRDAKYRRWQE